MNDIDKDLIAELSDEDLVYEIEQALGVFRDAEAEERSAAAALFVAMREEAQARGLAWARPPEERAPTPGRRRRGGATRTAT